MEEKTLTYWKKRLQSPLHKAYNENEMATRKWLEVYKRAASDIKAEMFNTYQKLNVPEPMISDFYTYNGLQSIEKQIDKAIIDLGKQENTFAEFSIRNATIIGSEVVSNSLNVNALNRQAIDVLIKNPWQDSNFSDRIWKNKSQLINALKSDLTNGIVQGKSIYQVANTIDERLDVGRGQTQRLVRTEYMHAMNQGQIETYKENGYEKLEWVATMDDKTSDICRKRNGKTYSVDSLPDIPAHPNCRCTLVPIIDTDELDKRVEEIRQLKNEIKK